MKKYESGFIKPEDIKAQTYIRHEHNITRYDEVKIIHIPTGISSFASSLNGQLAAYSMAMVMLEDKIKENDSIHDECEWDEIADIFTKAIKRKGLNKEQAIKMIEDIKQEARRK